MIKKYDEEAIASRIFSLLKEKYPDRDFNNNAEGSLGGRLEELLFWHEDMKAVNEMVNFLLSLNDEEIRSFCWNKAYKRDNVIYDGALKEMLDELEEAKEVWYRDYNEYLDDKKLFNQTGTIECGELKLVPTTVTDSEYLQKVLKTDDNVFAKGFYVSIRQFNRDSRAAFTIFNLQNDIVGFIALDGIQGSISVLPTEKTYNLEYYICPGFRGKRYAEIAAKTLLKATFAGKISVKKDGDEYGARYRFITVTLDVKLVNAWMKPDNVGSIKTALAIGFKDYGTILTIKNDKVVEYKNLAMVR